MSQWDQPVDEDAERARNAGGSATDAEVSSGDKRTSSEALGGGGSSKGRGGSSVGGRSQQQSAGQSNADGGAAKPLKVRTLHILKKHRGSRNPTNWKKEKVTRSKGEAVEDLEGIKVMLEEVMQGGGGGNELKETFKEFARSESDCSSSKRGGDLGFFEYSKMQPPFSQASFNLAVGGMSGVVESKSGVHLILRVG